MGGIGVWKVLLLRELWMEKRNSFEIDLDQLMVGVLSSYIRGSYDDPLVPLAFYLLSL